ncbi:MAG: hypothetical protein IJC67_07720 [Clostridia bacterium]|nr:hypothetical protein [Clostridia bacterium]
MRKGFGGSLLGNALTLVGFLVGFLLIPGQNIWIGVIGALVGYLASYIIRKKSLPKNERIRTLAAKVVERMQEGADAVQFAQDGIRIILDGRQQTISMAALGGLPLKDSMETNALAEVVCELLCGSYHRVQGAFPVELRKGAPETT